MSAPASNPVVTDIFVAGARKGWNIATTSTLPNVVMAFIIIKALEITGALKGLGILFAPLMGLFGLPGEAAAVLIGGWMSMGGGIGVAIGLFDKGILTGEHLAILAPAIYLMGSQVQYIGRILGVIGTQARRIPLMIGVSVINAFIAMLLMRIIL
ncbi:membrane protein [Salmonella enterica subsp. enterica serovar Choleraesuis]|nr:membrane protein [Salmonella enterica subsp. enterica serovar Choleraesuis]